jgi:hypothetical protein
MSVSQPLNGTHRRTGDEGISPAARACLCQKRPHRRWFFHLFVETTGHGLVDDAQVNQLLDQIIHAAAVVPMLKVRLICVLRVAEHQDV